MTTTVLASGWASLGWTLGIGIVAVLLIVGMAVLGSKGTSSAMGGDPWHKRIWGFASGLGGGLNGKAWEFFIPSLIVAGIVAAVTVILWLVAAEAMRVVFWTFGYFGVLLAAILFAPLLKKKWIKTYMLIVVGAVALAIIFAKPWNVKAATETANTTAKNWSGKAGSSNPPSSTGGTLRVSNPSDLNPHVPAATIPAPIPEPDSYGFEIIRVPAYEDLLSGTKKSLTVMQDGQMTRNDDGSLTGQYTHPEFVNDNFEVFAQSMDSSVQLHMYGDGDLLNNQKVVKDAEIHGHKFNFYAMCKEGEEVEVVVCWRNIAMAKPGVTPKSMKMFKSKYLATKK